jgi:hypothetical protein
MRDRVVHSLFLMYIIIIYYISFTTTSNYTTCNTHFNLFMVPSPVRESSG